MDVLQYSRGPWTRIIKSDFQGFPVYIYQNPQKWILSAIFEERGGKPANVITQVYIPLVSDVPLGDFASKLKLDTIALSKNVDGAGFNYLILSSGVQVNLFNAQNFKNGVESQVRTVVDSLTKIRSLARSSDINLHGVEEMAEAEASFFGEPILGPLLSVAPTELGGGISTGRVGEVILGIDANNTRVVQPAVSFRRSLVNGGELRDRAHVLRVLIEGFLLSKVPVIIFDWNNSFGGLALPTVETRDFPRYQLNAEPVGFPVRHLLVGNDVHVDLNSLPFSDMGSLLGFGDSTAGKEFVSSLEIKRGSLKSTLDAVVDLEKKVDEKTGANIYRAIRIARILSMEYGAGIGAPVDDHKLLAPWVGGLGRVAIVNLKDFKPEIAVGICHSIISSIEKKYFPLGETSNVRGMIIIPESAKLLANDSSGISDDIVEMLNRLHSVGIGYVLESESDVDLKAGLIGDLEASARIVQGNEVGFRHSGGNPYRVFVRPTLSRE